MARMLIAYWPGCRRSAGKLKRPFSSVATLVVMVDPLCLALTTTPSIKPSFADDTVPDSAAAISLWAGVVAAGRTTSASAVAISGRCLANMMSLLRFRRISVQRLKLDDRGAVVRADPEGDWRRRVVD